MVFQTEMNGSVSDLMFLKGNFENTIKFYAIM